MNFEAPTGPTWYEMTPKFGYGVAARVREAAGAGAKFPVTNPVQVRDISAWRRHLNVRLGNLRGLEDGWNGPGSLAPSSETISRAVNLVETALSQTRHPIAPFVVPLADGGLQFEWHRRSADLEIAFYGTGEVSALFEDELTGEELEAEGHAAVDLLLRRAQRVAEEVGDAPVAPAPAGQDVYLFAA